MELVFESKPAAMNILKERFETIPLSISTYIDENSKKIRAAVDTGDLKEANYMNESLGFVNNMFSPNAFEFDTPKIFNHTKDFPILPLKLSEYFESITSDYKQHEFNIVKKHYDIHCDFHLRIQFSYFNSSSNH